MYMRVVKFQCNRERNTHLRAIKSKMKTADMSEYEISHQKNALLYMIGKNSANDFTINNFVQPRDVVLKEAH